MKVGPDFLLWAPSQWWRLWPRWGRWGPASRPDWWVFQWVTFGPLEFRRMRRNPPWTRGP